MKYWRMKDGKRIAIKDMTTSHINNCIKLLVKYIVETPDESIVLPQEVNEHTGHFFEEIEKRDNRYDKRRARKFIKQFHKEIKRRGAEC